MILVHALQRSTQTFINLGLPVHIGDKKCVHSPILQIVLPVLYYIPGDQNHHSYENSLDALLMIKNDGKLLALAGVKNIELLSIKNKYIINK